MANEIKKLATDKNLAITLLIALVLPYVPIVGALAMLSPIIVLLSAVALLVR